MRKRIRALLSCALAGAVGLGAHGCVRASSDAPPPPLGPRDEAPIPAVPAPTTMAAAVIPALDGVLFDGGASGTLAVLDLDRHTLSTWNVPSGTARGRVDLGAADDVFPVLSRFGADRVLVHRARSLTVVRVDTAEVLARHETLDNDRRFLFRSRGVCLMNGRCSFQLIDCADARPLGDVFRSDVSTRFHSEMDEDSDATSCVGSPTALGRGADVLVVAVRGVDGFADGLVGVDARTGAVRWSASPAWFVGASAIDSGVIDTVGFVPSNAGLALFSTETGAVLHRLAVPSRIRLAAPVPSLGALFVLSQDRASLFDLSSGAARWSVDIDPGDLAVVEGADYPELAYLLLRPTAPHRVRWLDAAGRVLETVTADTNEVLVPSAGPRWALLRATLRTTDTAGQVVPTPSHPFFEVVREHLPPTEHGPANHARVRAADTRAPLAEIDSDAWSLGEVARTDGRWLALYVTGRDRLVDGTIRLLEAR